MCLLWLIYCLTLTVVGYVTLGRWAVLSGLIISFATIPVFIAANRFYHFTLAGRPWQWLRTKLGWGLSVAELSRRLGIVASDLQSFQPHYTETFTVKKSGGRRRLMVPDEKTKTIQRLILRKLLKKLHVHPAAQGFVRGRSAVHNAAQHAGQAVVISMDVVDFFPSTKAVRVEGYFRRIGWNAEAARLLTRLTTHEDGLPQGAPTSPALSNLVNFYLDVQIAKAVASKKGTYTRYADDITISYPLDYPRTIQAIMDRVKRILKSKGYRIHGLKKRRVCRQHQCQIVTGLVVNVKPQLTRQQRRWLRAVKHRIFQGKQATISAQQLQGWISYERSIQMHVQKMEFHKYRFEDNRKVIRRRKRAHERGKARS